MRPLNLNVFFLLTMTHLAGCSNQSVSDTDDPEKTKTGSQQSQKMITSYAGAWTNEHESAELVAEVFISKEVFPCDGWVRLRTLREQFAAGDIPVTWTKKGDKIAGAFKDLFSVEVQLKSGQLTGTVKFSGIQLLGLDKQSPLTKADREEKFASRNKKEAQNHVSDNSSLGEVLLFGGVKYYKSFKQ